MSRGENGDYVFIDGGFDPDVQANGFTWEARNLCGTDDESRRLRMLRSTNPGPPDLEMKSLIMRRYPGSGDSSKR
jgi:hypothetical protein